MKRPAAGARQTIPACCGSLFWRAYGPGMGMMGRLALRTVDLARASGAHPNTVRLYSERGYLPPVLRSPTRYRLFEQRHLEHMRVARLLLRDRWPGRAIRRSATTVLLDAAARGLAGSLPGFEAHLAVVRLECVTARQACEVAHGWLQQRGGLGGLGGVTLTGGGPAVRDGRSGEWMGPGEVTRQQRLTYDTLRSWERSGLIHVARDPATGQRRFGPEDVDRLVVIRALREAGYSPMAVLRMLAAGDQGEVALAVGALLDPDGDEDLITASDRWVATLDEHERRAVEAVDLVAAITVQFGQPSTSTPGA